MPRTARPETRALLLERAAGMLARREPVSLRRLVDGTGVSTMAVYTYFDGMPGLLGAVRQEGFERLASRLSVLPETDDPVSDLAAVGAAYAMIARTDPELYVLMHDGALPLPDSESADRTLRYLVAVVGRAVRAERFDASLDAELFANELWVFGCGACVLFAKGVVPYEQIEPILFSGLVRLYRSAGDDAASAEWSFRVGWSRGEDVESVAAGSSPVEGE